MRLLQRFPIIKRFCLLKFNSVQQNIILNKQNNINPFFIRSLCHSMENDKDAKEEEKQLDNIFKQFAMEKISPFSKEDEQFLKQLENEDIDDTEKEFLEELQKENELENSDFGSTPEYLTETFDKFNPEVIYDYDEEQMLREKGLWKTVAKKTQFSDLDSQIFSRGKTGVYDVEELVEVLQKQKAKDIVAIKIPAELSYCDYFVIASSKSKKHLKSVLNYVRKVYKKKKSEDDDFFIVEGKDSKWIAIDMLNIVLHLMMPDVRMEKDIETLWSVGARFDDKCNSIEPIEVMPELSIEDLMVERPSEEEEMGDMELKQFVKSFGKNEVGDDVFSLEEEEFK